MSTEENNTEKEENIFEDVKDTLIKHVEYRIDWYKLIFIEKSSKVMSLLIAIFIVSIISFLLLGYLSLLLGFLFSDLFKSKTLGFGLVTLLLLILLLIVILFRKKLIEKPITNSIIRKIFDNND